MIVRLGMVLLLLPVCVFADSVVPVDKVENYVNVRLNADANSDIVGRLRQGEGLPLIAVSEGWYEVELEGGATGFVSADWSRVEIDEPVAADEVIAEDSVAIPVAEETAAEVQAEPAPELAEELPPEPPVEAVVEAEIEDLVTPEPVPDAVVEADPEKAPRAEPAAEPVAESPSRKPVIKGKPNYLVRFKDATRGGSSQIFDDGNRIGIGTEDPQQRLEVNGSIQIHEQNSSVAGLMISQSSGDTGYIMHNRASTLTIGAGSQDRITIDRDGNVGIAVAKPNHPLEMQSGAHVTRGGVWTNRSSRVNKQNIESISAEEALAALLALEPVTYQYRNGDAETYAGFVAEDVPSLVAMQDGVSLSPMDLIAVLTKVMQQQQNRIDELERRLAED